MNEKQKPTAKDRRIAKRNDAEFATCKKDMAEVRARVSDIDFSLRMFYTYRKMTNRNPDIQVPFHFHNWIQRMCWAVISLYVRSMVEHRPGERSQVSFAKLLHRMKKNCEVFSLGRFSEQYEDALGRELEAAALFQQFSGPAGKHLASAVVESDLSKLQSSATRVKSVVDRVVAHVDRRGLPSDPAAIADVEDAVSDMVELTKKYSLLYFGSRELEGPPDEEFSHIFEVFLKPWTDERFITEVDSHQHDWRSWGRVGPRKPRKN